MSKYVATTATARRLVVGGLERVDTVLDGIPTVERVDGHWKVYRYGHWGCRLHLARYSAQIDERWHTGHWRDPTPEQLEEHRRYLEEEDAEDVRSVVERDGGTVSITEAKTQLRQREERS